MELPKKLNEDGPILHLHSTYPAYLLRTAVLLLPVVYYFTLPIVVATLIPTLLNLTSIPTRPLSPLFPHNYTSKLYSHTTALNPYSHTTILSPPIPTRLLCIHLPSEQSSRGGSVKVSPCACIWNTCPSLPKATQIQPTQTLPKPYLQAR